MQVGRSSMSVAWLVHQVGQIVGACLYQVNTKESEFYNF